MQGNGWNDIGYNFLVDKYGQIFEGRYGGIDKAVVGAHAQGFNTGSVGVAVLGEYGSTTISDAARRALVKLLAWRLDVAHVDPLSTLTWASGGNPRFPAEGAGRPARDLRAPRHRLHRLPGQRALRAVAGDRARGLRHGRAEALRAGVSGKLGGPVRFTGTPLGRGAVDGHGHRRRRATRRHAERYRPDARLDVGLLRRRAGPLPWIDPGPLAAAARAARWARRRPPPSRSRARPRRAAPSSRPAATRRRRGDGRLHARRSRRPCTATLVGPSGTAATVFSAPQAAGAQTLTYAVAGNVACRATYQVTLERPGRGRARRRPHPRPSSSTRRSRSFAASPAAALARAAGGVSTVAFTLAAGPVQAQVDDPARRRGRRDARPRARIRPGRRRSRGTARSPTGRRRPTARTPCASRSPTRWRRSCAARP